MPSLRICPRAAALTALAAFASMAPATASAERVAVVIGIGSYARLDPSLALPQANDDARRLAAVLEQEAGYDRVLSLGDALATRAAIRDLLLETLPAQLGADDSLLVYFAGHGVGGDFGEPYLLPYDVDPDDLQGTAISVDDLGSSLRNALQVGSLVMITDAVHDMRLGDLVLVGPNAKSWPDAADEFFSLSACSPREIPGSTPFGALLAQGLSGAADRSADGAVSASELVRFVLDGVATSGAKAHPAESGAYDPELVVARVTRGPQDFVSDPAPAGSARPRRVAGGTLAAVGLGLAGGGLGLYLDGRSIYEEAGAPNAEPSLKARYQRDKLWSPVLIGAGAASVLAGGVLLVLPTSTGASVGVHLEF